MREYLERIIADKTEALRIERARADAAETACDELLAALFKVQAVIEQPVTFRLRTENPVFDGDMDEACNTIRAAIAAATKDAQS